jgi:molybdenum cofactor cytidylyltransferase
MATSIAAGVVAIRERVDGFLIVPGDLPRLRFETLESLVEAFQAAGSSGIVVCATSHGWSSPTLLGTDYREQLLRLSGDEGAKSILQANVDRVVEVRVPPDELKDVDLPEDLA